MIPILHLFHPLGSLEDWRKRQIIRLSNMFDHINDQVTSCRQGFSLAETPGDSLCRLGDKLSLTPYGDTLSPAPTLSPNPALDGNRKS